MASALASFGALYAAVLLLMMGVGLLSTQLSLRLVMEGFSTQITGLAMSTYYLGLVFGSVYCRHLIQRVGHIRSFAAFAAAATAIVMLHGLYVSAVFWAALRLLTGIATIGLYMVIESWLGECADARFRGRVFSIYMVLCYLGLAIGQQLLNLGDVRSHELFFICGFLLTLCLVPVAVTHSIHPELRQPQRLNPLTIFRRAPIGALGTLAAGLITGSIHSMGPVLGHQIGLTVSEVSWFMSAAISGGLVFQWPVGVISDRIDRTKVLIALLLLLATSSALILHTAHSGFYPLVLSMVTFGGFAFTIYPVSVARTYDLFDSRDIASVSSVLLLFYGLGAAIGPIATSAIMTSTQSPDGFFVFCSVVGILGAATTLLFRQKGNIEIIPADDQLDFLPMSGTSPVTAVIDPRVTLAAENSVSRN